MHEISEADLKAREILKTAESAIRLQYADKPKELGGNEPAREARIRELTATELAAAEKMRALKGQAQLRADLANMRVQELQWLVRNDQATADLFQISYVPGTAT